MTHFSGRLHSLHPVAILALASLACSTITSSIGSASTATVVPPTAAPTSPPPTVTAPPPPTDTPPPTESVEPTASVEPSATPLFFGQLEIVPGRGFLSTLGSYVVVGEIVNHSDKSFDFVKVQVDFLDADGNRLGTEDNYVTPLPLAPGERGAFSVSSGVNGSVEKVASYTFLVQGAEETDAKRYSGLQVTVTAESSQVLSGRTSYTVAGTVTNIADLECTSATVTAAFYDAEGKVADVSVSSVDAEPLPPEESGAFEIYTGDLEEPYDHYQLWTACYTF